MSFVEQLKITKEKLNEILSALMKAPSVLLIVICVDEMPLQEGGDTSHLASPNLFHKKNWERRKKIPPNFLSKRDRFSSKVNLTLKPRRPLTTVKKDVLSRNKSEKHVRQRKKERAVNFPPKNHPLNILQNLLEAFHQSTMHNKRKKLSRTGKHLDFLLPFLPSFFFFFFLSTRKFIIAR